jgi:hypothetical protein
MKNDLDTLVIRLAAEEIEKICRDTDVVFLRKGQHKVVGLEYSMYITDCEIWTFITPKAGPKNLVVCDATQDDGNLLINWDRTPKWNNTLPRTNCYELADPEFPINLARDLLKIVLAYDPEAK